MPETISIIIVTYNTRELTLAAVRSVFESVDDSLKEVVVVDNGSADGTETAVMTDFPQVKYRYSDRNLGFAKANNIGATMSSGEWILLLNSDARLNKDSLVDALAYLRSHPECGVLGAQLLNADGSNQNSIASIPSVSTELLNKSLLRRLFPGRYPGKERRIKAPTEVDSVIGAFLMSPRSVWETVGGLDERYFFFLEETDYCLQVRNKGWAVVHHPGVKVWHGQGGTAKKVAAGARIEYWRSRYQFFEKHAEPGQVRMLNRGLMVRLVLNWLLNGLATVLTVGLAGAVRHRFKINHALLSWHFAGRPAGRGLPR